MYLCILHPPYTTIRSLAELEVPDPHYLKSGSVLAIRSDELFSDSSKLPGLIASLRSQAPLAPIVLWLGDRSPNVLRLTLHAGRLGVRGVILDDEPVEPALRRSLTRPVDLGGDVVEWLPLRGLRLSPAVAHLLTEVFNRAPRHAEVSTLLKEIHVPESTARSRLRKRRLPAPRRWLQTARALHAALRIQAEPGKAPFRHRSRAGLRRPFDAQPATAPRVPRTSVPCPAPPRLGVAAGALASSIHLQRTAERQQNVTAATTLVRSSHCTSVNAPLSS